jgi:hypothetical protein
VEINLYLLTREIIMNEINEFNQVIGCPIKNWQPVEMPSKVAINGTYCILEILDIDKHAAQLFETLSIDNRGESWTYLPYGPFKNCAEFQDWLKTKISEKDTLLYAVLDIKTRLPIGIAGFLRINPQHGVIEVGHLHYSQLLKKLRLQLKPCTC